MKFSFILLAHNEEKTIKDEIDNLYNKIVKKFSYDYEVLICEDGSTDNSKNIINSLKKSYDCKYIGSVARKGVSQAMQDAFKVAKGEYIFFTDAGKKFEFDDFWKLYSEVKDNDLVSGLRVNRKDQKYRIFLTYMFNLFLKFSLKSKFKDIDSGFKIFRRSHLIEILSKKPLNSDFLSAEICLKFQYKKFRVKEVRVDYFQRNEVSKALPIYKIPALIFRFLLNFHKLKKELNSYSH